MRLLLALLLAILALPSPAQDAARDAAPEPRFDVLEFEISGNTLLPDTAIERAVYPHLGEDRTVADIDKAAADLRRAYADAGFPLIEVNIPEQRVTEGVVRLEVVEGRVHRVRVTGARYFSQGWIRERVPALVEGETLDATAVQDQLAQLNRTPDRRVTPVLKPGPFPGTTDVELQVADRLPLHGSLELNNRYSANTSWMRLTGAIRYDNLWQREHSVGLQYQTSPLDLDEVEAAVLTYALPFPGRTTTLSAYYLYSNSNVAALGGFNVAGRANVVGLRLNQPLGARGAWSQFLSLGIDYKDFDENLNTAGSDPITSPVTYSPLSVLYFLQRASEEQLTSLSAGLTFSLRGVNADPVEFENKRFSAGTNFVVFRWDLQHTQPLPRQFAAYVRFDGQLADQPLVSNEQYFAGGQLNVRGYLEAEALGDDAYHGTAELRTPSFAQRIGPPVSEARALVFTEGAVLRVRKPLPEQADSFTLASFGGGLRFRLWSNSTLSLNLGWPLRTTVNTRAWEPRFQFTAVVEM